MNYTTHRSITPLAITIVGAIIATISFLGVFFVARANAASTESTTSGRLISLYDRGTEHVFVTKAATVGEALKDANVALDARDTVEPSVDEVLVADEYKVNVYRARPVLVVDGAIRTKIITSAQTAPQIAKSADITLYDEDKTAVERSNDVVADGAGLKLVVTRATPFTFTLYGKTMTARTQATTVGTMLKEKNITLGEDDRVSVDLSTPITNDLSVRVWREGKQTITVDEEVAFETEIIKDANRELGYKQIQTIGEKGARTVTYEVIIQDGQEVGRTEIATIITREALKQVEIVGSKTSGNPLTKSMGVNQFTDSNGVTHRETYYDLPMNIVMRNCGGNGTYTVRTDGAKIDKDGYIIVAAHLGNYPRCSVVETSMGQGKVYDTGGFVAKHPHGFDLATDWSNYNGI